MSRTVPRLILASLTAAVLLPLARSNAAPLPDAAKTLT
jgi:hypothetical protein